jgi:hypothetical protein
MGQGAKIARFACQLFIYANEYQFIGFFYMQKLYFGVSTTNKRPAFLAQKIYSFGYEGSECHIQGTQKIRPSEDGRFI